MASQRNGATGESRASAAISAQAMASSEPKKVTFTVTQAPCSSRGSSSIMMALSGFPER